MPNITLSADERLLADARAYAAAHDTTLNQLIRDFLARVTNQETSEQAAEEFVRLATEKPGRSEPGFRFNRSEAHQRGGYRGGGQSR
jgi:hypothetical protein